MYRCTVCTGTVQWVAFGTLAILWRIVPCNQFLQNLQRFNLYRYNIWMKKYNRFCNIIRYSRTFCANVKPTFLALCMKKPAPVRTAGHWSVFFFFFFFFFHDLPPLCHHSQAPNYHNHVCVLSVLLARTRISNSGSSSSSTDPIISVIDNSARHMKKGNEKKGPFALYYLTNNANTNLDVWDFVGLFDLTWFSHIVV